MNSAAFTNFSDLVPDTSITRRFLELLAPGETEFTFQTFADDKIAQRKLAHVFHGPFADHERRLLELNAAGAGVFVTINQTNLLGRKATDVTRVRALFVDADGVGPDCLRLFPLQPSFVVVTSPGKFHAYWLVDDVNLGQFKDLQRGLAHLMGTDSAVCDLPRLVRVAGFIHRKNPDAPFLSRLVTPEGPASRYSLSDVQRALHQHSPSAHVASTSPARNLMADPVNGNVAAPDMAHGYPDGHRTRELLRRAGYCLGPQRMSEADTIEACLQWNHHNLPPLPVEKIESTVRSIAKTDRRKRDARDETSSRANVAASDGPETHQSVFHKLSTLSPVEYDQVRKKEADSLGIRVTTLDDEIAKLRPDTESEQSAGRALTFPPIEPWPEPVDGSALLGLLKCQIKAYVALPDDMALAVALWVLHAHAPTASLISPRLAITSPEKRCGKSTLLRVVSELVPKPIWAANITSAAVFRTVEACQPSLLIDEADSFLTDNEELRGILNAGHQRGMDVVRLTGEDHEPRKFSAFCPTAIAAIGRLPSTIEDRSVIITMKRRRPEEKVERFRSDQPGKFEPLRQMAARWVENNEGQLRFMDPGVPEALHDRAADNWRPLLAIAELCGDEWSAAARKAAVSVSGGSDVEQGSLGTLLLADLRAYFEAGNNGPVASAAIVDFLVNREDRPWSTINKGGAPLNPNRLARMLKEYGIGPQTHRLSPTETRKGYHPAQFADAFARYLPTKA